MFLPIAHERVQHQLKEVSYFLNGCIRGIIVFSISFYQRFLSRLKGFSCAYRVHYKAESCSCYVKRVFLEQDLQTAILLSKQRFQECSNASQIFMLKQKNPESVQNLIGRRKIFRLFSFFPLVFLSPQVRGGCPGVNACCSSMFEDKDNERNK